MIRNGILPVAAVCACLMSTATATSAGAGAQGVEPQPWQRVGTGITGGVSGMALVHGTAVGSGLADVVVVRDNKDAGQDRVVSVWLRPGAEPVTRALDWEGPLPKDLEALDAVPGQKDQYIAVTSKGLAYPIAVTDGTAIVGGEPFALPERAADDNYESFALSRHPSGRTFAVWATRGSSATKAVVRAAVVSFTADGINIGAPADTRDFGVPFPDEDDVRHISDLKILTDGTLLVSSASDPDTNDGPFSSAVYNAGTLAVDRDQRPVLRLQEECLVPLGVFTKADDRKIEAVVHLPDGQQIWGTDDENNGGSVLFHRTVPAIPGSCGPRSA
ncbi:hypothetical protein [Streptomyces albipurpureus]|uniref:Phytase-like domain-containing protein n=1 Tax=Streptomyces albipurpureus TaxID=2897419 RepID=A0ABT0UQ02_9ACTN|nr:hypothetical protein [Streptomyces sp. CWNU-1]MCM2390539.1 hypothetical protein [Streptomyces sp. CWNU-1]